MVLLLSLVTSKTHHALSLRERFAAIVSNFTTSLSAAPSDSPCHHGARRRMVINSSTATLTDGDEKKKSPLLCHHDHDNETNKSDQSSKFFCGICLDDKPVSDMFKVGKCEHSFCTHGISKHVATQMHQNILVASVEEFYSHSFGAVYREGNMCADKLAGHAQFSGGCGKRLGGCKKKRLGVWEGTGGV
ncbi:hypothetical protein JHK84_049445 [Glycine max]|nr:hypothetical protein JHK84_049445 [Glycine max]